MALVAKQVISSVETNEERAMKTFFKDYAFQFQRLIDFDNKTAEKLIKVASALKDVGRDGGTTWLLGNGGSNAICSHLAIDLTKNCRLSARCFSDGAEITCLANDFGHEKWMAKAIELSARQGDFVIFVSSSGNSQNIVNAANFVVEHGLNHASFSGMEQDNQINQICDLETNFWVDSKAYNFIEMAHQFYLLAIVDFIIGRTVYPSVRAD